jgi:nucleotide-binding universal stress UspA family protein
MARRFRRLLVPYDFSRDADRALATALGLARRESARVTVLHVVSPIVLPKGFPPTATFCPPTPALLAELRRRLDRRIARATGGRRTPPVIGRVVAGDPHRSIIAATRGADLVVMGTQGLTGISHLLIGSVAEKVVRHSPVPVLTLRRRGRAR